MTDYEAMSAGDMLERHLIGAILRRPEAAYEAMAQGLAQSDFADRWASEAFRAILSLLESQAPVTPSTVANRCTAPLVALELWFEDTPPNHLRHLCAEVRRAGAQRSLSHMLRGLAAKADVMEPSEVLAAMTQTVEQHVSDAGAVMLDEAGDAALEQIDPKNRRRYMLGTGLPHLDRALAGGINAEDEQLIIAADTGCGKTTLGLQILAHVAMARRGVSPLLFSLEMTEASVAMKVIGALSGVPVRKGSYTQEEWSRLVEARARLAEIPIRVATQSPDADSIEGAIRSHVQQYGQTPIMVDYIQLMRARGDGIESRVSLVSSTLRRVGRTLGVPIIAIAQLNRTGKNKTGTPSRSDMKGAGQIEDDATTIVGLWRPEEGDPTVCAQVLKQRFQGTGDPRVMLKWAPSGQKFICGECEEDPCACRW